MIITSNNVDLVLRIISSDCEVLPRCDHLTCVSYFTFVINHVASRATRRLVSLESTHQEELVVRDVDALEVVWHLVLGYVLVVVKLQLLELASLFDVVKCLQLMRVEGDQRH